MPFLLGRDDQIIIRSVPCRRRSGLRLVPVGDAAAKSLDRYSERRGRLLGMAAACRCPSVNQSVNAACGCRGLGTLSVMVLLYLVYIVLPVAKGCLPGCATKRGGPVRRRREGVDRLTHRAGTGAVHRPHLHGLAGTALGLRLTLYCG